MTLIHNEKPKLETSKCNAYECRKRLMRGERINHVKFIQEVGDHRLSAHIHVLSHPKFKWKWRINTGWVEVYNPLTGRCDRRKEYWLDGFEIDRINKRAQARQDT